MSEMTTWSEQLLFTMERNGEKPEQLLATTLTEELSKFPFEDNFGTWLYLEMINVGLVNWFAWTETCVYFPEEYDGRCSVGSAPRHPPHESSRLVPAEHNG